MKIIIRQGGPIAAVLELNPVTVEVASLDAEPVLEWLFRQFNAVDGRELFSLLPIQMPSLSVGDEVEFVDQVLGPRWEVNAGVSTTPPRRFRCMSFGWEEIT